MATLNRPVPRTFHLVLILVILAMLGVPAVARSATPVRDWKRYDGWSVKSFAIVGLPEHLPAKVKTNLALAGRAKLLRRVRPPYTAEVLAKDLARLRLHLAREGYPQAVVTPELTLYEEGRQLDVLIRVKPGPPVRVASLALTGWPDRLPRPDPSDEDILQTGDIFRDEAYARTKMRLLGLLQGGGFAGAKVEPRFTPTSSGGVDLTFQTVPGDYQVIDELVIAGCSEDLLPVSRRVANFKPGTEYDPERLIDMANDLRGTQLFGRVELKTVPVSPGHLRLDADLANARMRTWDASVGTWSDNPWMVRAGWTHRNLFSRGVGFYARGVFAEHEQSLATGVTWLGWLSPRARTRSGIEYVYDDEDAYRSKEAAVEIVQSFRPSKKDILQVGITASHVDVVVFNADDDEVPDDSGKLLEFWADWKMDRTDNPVFPRRGFYVKLSGTFAPPLPESEFPYVAVQNDWVFLQSLGEKLVLTQRLRLGWSSPMGEADDLLPNRRFYAGGYNSMRGYERRRLGPTDTGNNPRGGQTVFLAGAEARFPLFWILEGAAFVDAGQVWRQPGDAGLADVSVAVGVAVDLRTPIGPLRVNRAWNVQNQLDGEPDKIWQFGIGYPW